MAQAKVVGFLSLAREALVSQRKPSDTPINNSRRQLLIHSGILGAAAAVAPSLFWSPTAQAIDTDTVDWTVEQLNAALLALRDDTFFGLIAFGVPGNDPHSEAQGVSTAAPGGIGTRADLYLAGGTDLLVPIPPPFMQQLLDSVGAYLALSPISVPEGVAATLGENQEWLLENLDNTLSQYLEEGVPNTVFAALLLNLAATRVAGAELDGPFLAPFSNLTWEQKAKVFESLDGERSWIKTTVQWRIPNPDYREATPGVLQSIIAFLLRIAGFGSYCEFAVFNPETRTIAQRPLGWVLSNYEPDSPPVSEGTDDFLGYFQDRRSV